VLVLRIYNHQIITVAYHVKIIDLAIFAYLGTRLSVCVKNLQSSNSYSCIPCKDN